MHQNDDSVSHTFGSHTHTHTSFFFTVDSGDKRTGSIALYTRDWLTVLNMTHSLYVRSVSDGRRDEVRANGWSRGLRSDGGLVSTSTRREVLREVGGEN